VCCDDTEELLSEPDNDKQYIPNDRDCVYDDEWEDRMNTISEKSSIHGGDTDEEDDYDTASCCEFDYYSD
jgi:hypothetical protein